MRYILINPVVDEMYGRDILDTFLTNHGYERLECRTDWKSVVLQKYYDAALLAGKEQKTVADVRCPVVEQLLRDMNPGPDLVIPDIRPILLHAGTEASSYAAADGRLCLVTTPCQALADMGNRLQLPMTEFISWNRFLRMTGELPQPKQLHKSPIPPGFFRPLPFCTDSITGEASIRSCLENRRYQRVQLLEMLFCRDGCHHGDGVCMT